MKNVIDKEIEKHSKRSILTVVLLFTLIIAFFSALKQFNWVSMIMIIITFILICLPRVMKEVTKSDIPINFIDIPKEFEIFIIIFTYATLFLGELNNYYATYWWWDIALHTSSALVFGLIGFMILFILYRKEKIKASPKTIAMFSFAFALAIGALWEIVEYTIDSTFGSISNNNFMQTVVNGCGLVDTMTDLIVDIIGALISSIAGYMYLKGKNEVIVKPIMKEFKKGNPKLFKKKTK